ncbi:MAG: hypothetical protein U0822_19040 [Anaerolineae bacterium]
MIRPMTITIAAVLQFLWSACMIVFSLPDLAKGATTDRGGFAGYMVTVIAFAAGVLGLVAAYGTWRNSKAGRILALVVNAVFVFLFVGAVLFASPSVKMMAGVLLIIPVLIIVLLLWRSRQAVAT